MSTWFEYACPNCHVIVGGWSLEPPPFRCPVCGKVVEWERNAI